MACKTDVKVAILNEVMKEAVEGRYTFNRISNDSIIITNTGKAKSEGQAKAIAKSLADRIEKSFLGHVKGVVSQASQFDPVMVTFNVSQQYIDYVFSTLPSIQRDSSTEANKEERDHINNNTGFNTNTQLELFSVATTDVEGVFPKYVKFKESQLKEYKERLSKVQANKKRAGLSVNDLKKLNKQERDLKLQIDGSDELNIKGLKQEISELRKNSDINAVGYYIEKDLQRLAALATSNDVDDLREAERIIKYYTLLGTFSWPNKDAHPLYSAEDIFLKDDTGELTKQFKLSAETRKKFEEWRDRAVGYSVEIDKRKEEITVNIVNNDGSVQNTYKGRKFTFGDLIYDREGLRDADFISMWTMDITQGIFSTNGLIPQTMFSYLSNMIESKSAWSKDIAEKVDKMMPDLQKELIKLPKGSLRGNGILGLKGASYQIFKEITKEGNETGGLVQRFVKEFFDAQSKAKNTFQVNFEDARNSDDPSEKRKGINKAFEELKKWRRDNTIIMDITRLPEFSENSDNSYKDYLISVLGQKGYDEQVERQKNMLQKFEADKQSMLETALEMEGVDAYDKLSDESKSNLSYWENNNSPFKGIEDYMSVNGIFYGDYKANNFMSYNNFIPRKFKATIGVNQSTNQYTFTDTTTDTGFYSEVFTTIEKNPVLSQFYDVLKEVTGKIREEMPYELQQEMAANTLPALQKTSAEIIADNHTGVLSSLVPAFKKLMERIRLSFGVTKQSESSYATIDPITGKANYKVNDQFLRSNSDALSQRMLIESTKFLQALNSTRKDEEKMKAIKRFTVISLDSMNDSSLILLAKYLHIEVPLSDIKARRLDAFRRVTGDTVEIGKYLRDFSLHTVVQTQSFDLPKLMKYFSSVTMMYAARKEALPILEIMKRHYEGIKNPKTNNLDNGILNRPEDKYLMTGLRTNANRQMEDWFERVGLGNYETKHFGPHGKETKVDKLIDGVKSHIPRYFKDIYSDEDKKKIKEINELLKHETDDKKIAQLKKTIDSLGKVRTATAFFDNLLGWIRTLRLGYNFSSASTNLLEGFSSNMILASLGEYFDPKEIYYGYSVTRSSFVKNVTFGAWEMGSSKKNRMLMDKFNVLIDSRNELQKSSNKTYADKMSWLNPHALNQRVEYVNQSPIMIAMLRTIKIKDKNGNESSVWDAMTSEGHLKDDFRTEENVNNWENLNGQDYLTFKQKLHKAIGIAHGLGYDELRGMMLKSNTAGKALAMFKTWLPSALYWRFAVQQDDIQSGIQGFKGRYWSFGKGSGLLYGATLGTAIFGPLGTLIGAGVGTIIGSTQGKKFAAGLIGFNIESNADPGIGLLKETATSALALAKRMIGTPVNMIAGKQLIDSGGKDFEDWVGKGDFTAQDAKNLRGNMSDIALQLAWLAMILMVKALLWDDDDKKDDASRRWHNLMINKLMQLSTQASMYVNPPEIKKTLTDIAVVKYIEDVIKVGTALQDWANGRDVKSSGINAGESGVWNSVKKIALPGLIKDTSGGFEGQMERVFKESPFHQYFKSEEKLDAEDNKIDRTERRQELEEALDINSYEGETLEDKEKAKQKEIKKILDEELPTPAKLKKLEMTREDYEKSRKEQE